MSKKRENLRRFQSGMSQRSIALGLHVSRNTVAKIVAAYKSSSIPKENIPSPDSHQSGIWKPPFRPVGNQNPV